MAWPLCLVFTGLNIKAPKPGCTTERMTFTSLMSPHLKAHWGMIRVTAAHAPGFTTKTFQTGSATKYTANNVIHVLTDV